MIPPLPFPEADPCIRVVWVQFQHFFPHLVIFVISVATVVIIVIVIILIVIIVFVIIVIVIILIIINLLSLLPLFLVVAEKSPDCVDRHVHNDDDDHD